MQLQKIQEFLESNPLLEMDDDDFNDTPQTDNDKQRSDEKNDSLNNSEGPSIESEDVHIDSEWTESIPEELSIDSSWEDSKKL